MFEAWGIDPARVSASKGLSISGYWYMDEPRSEGLTGQWREWPTEVAGTAILKMFYRELKELKSNGKHTK